MNRIRELFSAKTKDILNVYCTAGFPHQDSIMEVLYSLKKYGADMAEIGIPYSDPLADGPVIQQSNMRALQNGMTIHTLFQQLKNLRSTHSPLAGKSFPIILMGYLNPVMQYGVEQFCIEAKAAGIDGVILPDLPLYEFENAYQELFKKHGLNFIFLITPETSVERIKKIDDISSGFIYAVSSSSTTGKDTDLELQKSYFKRLQALQLKNPVLVGFGIKNKQTFTMASEYLNGAIIGSAYIKCLQINDDIDHSTKKFLNEILN